MGVQIGLSKPVVRVVENGGDQSVGLDLCLPRGAGSGVRGVLLQQPDRGIPRRVVRPLDRLTHPWPRVQTPQPGDGGDRGEYQIEARHRPPLAPGLLPLDLLLLRPGRLPAGLPSNRLQPSCHPLVERPEILVLGERAPE